IGKKFLSLYLRGYLKDGLNEKFRQAFKLTNEQILERIYMHPLPNRFCGGISKFVFENFHDESCREIIYTAFHDFFKNIVSHYPRYEMYTFNCVGSIGFNFKDALIEVAAEY